MADIGREVSDLVLGLKQAQTKSDLMASLEAWKLASGLDWYSFGLNRAESMQVSEHVILTNYPDDWMSMYEGNKLFLIDPVVKYVLNHQSPVLWSEFVDIEGYNTHEQQKFMQHAREYGLVCGCSFPCNSYGNYGVFSVASKLPQQEPKLEAQLPYNLFYANQLLESMLRIELNTAGKNDGDNLSDREIECLIWGSDGKTAGEIAEILGISERTVVFHFTNAGSKLRTTNRQHTISKAMILGILKPSV